MIQAQEARLEEALSHKSLIVRCAQDKEELNQLLQKQAREISQLKKQAGRAEARLTETEQQLKLKASIEAAEELQQLVQILPKADDVEKQNQLVAEQLKWFETQKDFIKKEFRVQGEIIRRFDEVLCSKASKLNLVEDFKDFDQTMDFKLKKLKDHADQIGSEVKETNHRLDQFKQIVEEDFNEKMHQVLRKATIQQRAGGAGHTRTPTELLESMEGLENIKRMLSLKADKADLEKLDLMKCNKVDSENMLDIQSIMCRQFQHILVLFIEIINCQVKKESDTKQAGEARMQNLISQVRSLSNWVLHFNPVDYMNSADAANIQLVHALDENAFKKFSEMVLNELDEQRKKKRGPAHLQQSARTKTSPTHSLFTDAYAGFPTRRARQTSKELSASKSLTNLANPLEAKPGAVEPLHAHLPSLATTYSQPRIQQLAKRQFYGTTDKQFPKANQRSLRASAHERD